MAIIDKFFEKGNYTAYGVPTVQIEGSFIWFYDDIETMKEIPYYGALAIFETPGMTSEKFMELCPLRNAEMGAVLNWMRKEFKLVEQIGEFWSDDKEDNKE